MQRPPRDAKKDRLVSFPLLVYSYCIAGSAEMLTCMAAFFLVYVDSGIPISSLAWSQETYWASGSPDFVANGRVFNDTQQVALYQESVSSWYATIVLCQFWHVWLCKTRVTSIFEHGVFENKVTLIGVSIALFLVLIVVFIPGLQYIFMTGSLRGVIWPVHLIFPTFMLCYTEATKFMVRNYPDSTWATSLGW